MKRIKTALVLLFAAAVFVVMAAAAGAEDVWVDSWAGLKYELSGGFGGYAEKTVRLQQDITRENDNDDAINISFEDGFLTLDLYGHTIDNGESGAPLFQITQTSGTVCVWNEEGDEEEVPAAFVITDSREGGKIRGTGEKLIDVQSGCVMTLAGGSIESTAWNYAVYVDCGTFAMTGGSISAEEYGVWLNSSNFTMTDGMIADCYGGLVFMGTCNFTMTGGTITSCGWQGVLVSEESSVFLSGSPVISGNDTPLGTRDLVLPLGRTVTVDGPLTGRADIGVRIDGGSGTGVFAVGTDSYSIKGDDLAHFRSDEPNNYAVELNDKGEAVLSEILGTRLAGYTISLDGDIGVNFYIELDEDIAQSNTAYMKFTVPNGETQTVYVKDADQKTVGGKNCHVFKCTVAAKEMTAGIKAQIVDGEARGTEYTYSVKEYADYLLAHTGDNTAYANAAPLVRAMLNYGAQSQNYFGYNTGRLANAGLSDAEKTLGAIGDDVPADYTETNLPEGVTFEGATLTLRSETSLSLYFKDANEGNGTLTFAPSGFPAGVTLEPEQNLIDGCRVVRIRGIQAKYLGDSFTVSVTKDDHTGSVTHSPMTYCKKAEAGSDTNLANVAKALYAYWTEAKTYFNYTGNSNS